MLHFNERNIYESSNMNEKLMSIINEGNVEELNEFIASQPQLMQ